MKSISKKRRRALVNNIKKPLTKIKDSNLRFNDQSINGDSKLVNHGIIINLGNFETGLGLKPETTNLRNKTPKKSRLWFLGWLIKKLIFLA